MEYYIWTNPPIPLADIRAIEDMLREADLFCAGFDADLYSLSLYLEQNARFETTATLVLDRNIFTRIISLASGRSADTRDFRLAAAAMAFAQCANLLVDPALVLYEFARGIERQATIQELGVFRAADNLHPSFYADVALERADRLPSIPPFDIRPPFTPAEFAKPLSNWTFDYAAVLMLALIELEGGEGMQKLLRFMDWMYKDFFFSAPAFRFASQYFSPRRQSRMLKRLRSSDRVAALEGVRNSAWDLALIHYWLSNVDQQNTQNNLAILCSMDKALCATARGLIAPDGRVEEGLRNTLENDWGRVRAAAIISRYADYNANLRSDVRRATRGFSTSQGEGLIADLERRLLASTL
jgi:hypothetical protein